MRVIESEMIVKQTVKTYIAEDGQEFQSESKCREHDAQLEFEKSLGEIKPLMIYEDNYIPCNGGENYENHLYRWFKVEDQEQLDKVNDLYNTRVSVKNFPEYVSIEQLDETDFDCYGATLTECKEYVTKFFGEGFGVKVKFE